MRNSLVSDCQLLELPQVHKLGGNITAINNGQEIHFNIKRIYYLYDVPGGEGRGGHAHKELHQLIIAGSGSFDIHIDDGKSKKSFHLSRPYKGLLMPPGLWRELDNFSSGSICLVLASTVYAEEDYIRDYNDFLRYKK
jgi:hypothetical protein